MFQSKTVLSIAFGLATILPLAFASACGSDDDDDDGGANTGGAAGNSGNSGNSGNGGSGNAGDSGASEGDTGSGGDANSGGNTSTGGNSSTGGAANQDGLGPDPVLLGAASDFAILAKSTITNEPTSAVTGDLGLSPAAASYVKGFSLTRSGTSWTSSQVVGSVFAADNDPPTPTQLTTAIGNMETAYTDAAGRSSPDFLNLGEGSIGGQTLVPGLYKWTSTLTIPTDVTLEGGKNDVWIFQVTGDLELSSAKKVLLSGGAQPQNIFWQVAGLVNFGTTSHAEGIVLSKTAINLKTGSSINGRLLAQTAVNLAGATVKEP